MIIGKMSLSGHGDPAEPDPGHGASLIEPDRSRHGLALQIDRMSEGQNGPSCRIGRRQVVPKPFRHVLSRGVETPAASDRLGVEAWRCSPKTAARHQAFALLFVWVEARIGHAKRSRNPLF